ncbi:fasciclin domain-containing protein [Microlunatus antarcticus]|uniref:Putative surface protein with fasciclin (FAS1) repeats n=1 Tax=Microlunatus antarcticus TaxID=53388 RepID=A0A7W5P697_9ACTN|nr:fasciclin domain-containing protein [Microlunatus antarcticus]MBB3326285.1 putative surface protein with fasciclin (FAS1) repeats [Microlunatus antarcticus]
MNFKSSATKIAALAAVVAFPLSLAACGDTADSGAAPASSAAAPSSSAAAPSSSAASPSASASDASAPFGSGCAAVPTSGKGSFDGMSQDPVATAASNNPALSTLVTAVKAAGLVDTLNNAENITVFAPTNDAFKKIPAADLKKVLADKKTLTAILTGHVTSPKLAPTDLAGSHTSLAKTDIKVTGSGEDFTVDGTSKVVCGNVQTANATVYIIDTVLLPKS